MASEFVERRLIEEREFLIKQAQSADQWQGLRDMPLDVLEHEADHDESMFGYEGFCARAELLRRRES